MTQTENKDGKNGAVKVIGDKNGAVKVSDDKNGVVANRDDKNGAVKVSEDNNGVVANRDDKNGAVKVSEDNNGVAANRDDKSGAAKTPPLSPRTVLLAAAVMCLATLFFSLLDSTAKYLGAQYAIAQIVFVRYATHLLFIAAFLAAAGKLRKSAKSGNLRLQLIRSATLILTTIVFFWALRFLPLAEAIAVMLLTPIFTTLLAVPLLRERVGLYRAAGILIGLAGGLIVVRPGGEVFQPAGAAALFAAFTYALYQIQTRRLSAFDGPMTTTLYTSLVGTVAVLPVVPFVWSPFAGGDLIFAAALGVYAILSHGLLIFAFSLAPASLVTGFGYVNIFWATLLGWVFFRDFPDALTIAGVAVIILGGLFILWRESVRNLDPSQILRVGMPRLHRTPPDKNP
ncbi:MAG: DMT family transporter [Alphaproteobacteria bacterium]|nr:DMT family transporter [Alphaproteobacteria bacterium]